MQSGHITTPFGRRSVTLALVKGQLDTAEFEPTRRVEKWKVYRDVCEASKLLVLGDRPIAVLNALLTFYPATELSEERGLVVFPSNAQLAVRAHGISASTLRRSLSALVDAGLVHRRDSPNGKRYAHRDRAGQIEEAFGFSLAPLLARADELAQMAQQAAEEERRFRRAREALTICRRDVRKMITAAMEEGADGDWAKIEDHFLALIGRLPRSPRHEDVTAILEEMSMLRDEIVNILEIQLKSENMHANGGQNDCHIQNSKPESFHELEPSSEEERGEVSSHEPKRMAEPLKAYPLSMVLKACPQISDYVPGGQIAGWRDVMTAAVVVRSMLSVSPSAYQEACEVLGPENAATAIACILERAEHIKSAGGYLRDLTRKAARGEFGLGPMLMAAMRANAGVEKRSA
ncbi:MULTISPECIES: plasmid replication protein RepC [unclassified Shinella]|uniref:plasmid replication protein RepC n=1 Tax=unclassified Shinella TaxID=2643062 RepID=UPI0003C5678A|nr:MULTISPECIES: plasmid replication protein RepC [unclassified Shinella]EYR79585.1 replication protein RepC [Shinella sp. DD12]EYR79590.1 putative replication protein C [Shinella sp. DD12]MCW5712036.1 replication initiation protein RepC [Shinella sp.]TAA50523.1 replication initiation protein RepC [Shinella sp. JR1-6]